MVNNMFVLFHGYLVHKTQGNTVLIQYVNECAKQLLKQISRNHDNVPESWSYDCFLNSCDHNSIRNLCKLHHDSCALVNKQKPRGTDHFSLELFVHHLNISMLRLYTIRPYSSGFIHLDLNIGLTLLKKITISPAHVSGVKNLGFAARSFLHLFWLERVIFSITSLWPFLKKIQY